MRKKPLKLMCIMSGILTAVFTLVTYETNRVIPFMMDDLWYSTLLFDENTPIASLSDIVRSQIWHYHNWGGRSMTHGILQLTLLAGENAADLLNVAFILLLAGMICLVSGYLRLPAFFAATGMVLGLSADWRMSLFWQSGAANYLYITVFILLFLFCYLRELPEEGNIFLFRKLRNKKSGSQKKQGEKPRPANDSKAVEGFSPPKTLTGITLWILPLGILAGWSNENMGPAAWILSLAVILSRYQETRKVKLWMALGNLACLAGSVLCIMAPGNFIRSRQIEAESYGRLWKLFLRSYGECKAALEYLFPVLLVLAALLLISRYVLGQRLDRREQFLLVCALLSWGAFILSPHYPARAASGTIVLCICVILSLARKILKQRADLAWPLWGGALLIWLRGMFYCGEWLALAWGWIK